jgi:uncharacterized protein (TIGR03083 family)
MTAELALLKSSVSHLRAVVNALSADDVRKQAYPSQWTVAATLSHLGSGATIARLGVDAALGGPPVAHQAIWDEWNAKTPDAQAADALVADRELIERLEAMSASEQADFEYAMGPMTLDFAAFVRLRCNEHVLHTWDIEVAGNSSVTLLADAPPVLLEILAMFVGFLGKPTGATTEVRIRTTDPDRRYVISTTPDAVTLAATDSAKDADLVLGAEALIRLVWGRLDVAHTPPFTGSAADLDLLRRTFPGI